MSRFYAGRTDLDLCPVCGQTYPLPGEVYCSKVCRVAAYNYRKRLSNVAAFLIELGFAVRYTNGVQLEITLPSWLRTFYPGRCFQMLWPEPNCKIESLNADDLWSALVDQLGELVADFMKWMCIRGQYHEGLLLDLSQMFVRSVSDTSSFYCEHCGGKFIKSSAAREPQDRMCVDCVLAAIPF